MTELAPEIEARLHPAPPRGWKRPPMTMQTKLQVILNQEGKCKATGHKIMDARHVRFDHRPAIWQRRYDPVTNDTVPSVNDAATIDAILKEEHHTRTFTDNGTGRGDLTHKAHVTKTTNREAEHRIAMALKEPGQPRVRSGKIPGRKFDGRPSPAARPAR